MQEQRLSVATSFSHSDQQQCAHCCKVATQICKGCAGAPDIGDGMSLKTFYCNTTCQKAHWSKHRPTCNRLSVRKKLYRAGGILQEIFYAYREITFDKMFRKIERQGKDLYMYEVEYDWQIPVPFPSALISSENERRAVLAYRSCDDALAYMYEIIKVLLKGEQRFSVTSGG